MREVAGQDVERRSFDFPGAAAIPRKNGELVFEAPWESRAFGVAVAMHEQGLFTWEEFRDGLVREIGQKQAARSWSYYECWLAALERLLEEKRLAGQREIEARATELEQLDDHG